MTTIDIAGSGYLDASHHLQRTHWRVVELHQDLARALAGHGAMAGDASIASAFAAAYDDAAAGTLRTVDDLADALRTLGRISYASLENHTRAERRSHLGSPTVLDADDGVSLDDGEWYDVTPAELPSSLGGDLSALPDWANAVLDRVEGFVWPDADVDQLRAAARVWRAGAERLLPLSSGCDRAVWALERERSPEIPLAVDHVREVCSAVQELAPQLTSIADSCDSYADQVEAQRTAILDLVHDMLRDAIIIQGVGILAGTITFGGATAGAAGLNGIKIAAEAPRFIVMVDAVRTASVVYSTAMRGGLGIVEGITLRLRRYRSARTVIDTSKLGTFRIGERLAPGFIRRFDIMGGHTLSRHVGQSVEQLHERLALHPKMKAASTFLTEEIAETSVRNALIANRNKLAEFLAGKESQIIIHARMPFQTGLTVLQNGNSSAVDGIRLVVRRTPSGGFRIHSSFPQASAP